MRPSGDDVLERICTSAYPQLVGQAYERLLASRPIDPLAQVGRPAAVANAEGATLVSRVAWLRLRGGQAHLRTAPCNDFHVCTLLDAELKAFASIGTRSAGSARQELVLVAPDGSETTTDERQHVRCPSELIAVLTHRVHFGRDGGAPAESPFRIEDGQGELLIDLDGAVETVDAISHVEALRPEQYFSDALAALGESVPIAATTAIKHAVQKSFATIAEADRSGSVAKGWTTIAHSGRERTPECRATAVHAGYFGAKSHDVLELATRCDATGKPLDGSRTYRVHFERWNEPPAHASWFFYVSPAVPARVDLVRAEPAMSITFGPTPPGGDTENWIQTLPEPAPLEVRLILCWPSERARSEIWTPPEILAV